MNWSDATFIPRNIYFINIAQNLPTIPQGENTVLGVHLAVREGKWRSYYPHLLLFRDKWWRHQEPCLQQKKPGAIP